MPTAKFDLRVNGCEIKRLSFRRKMLDGFPRGEWEPVVHDPILGSFAINSDDTFVLEFREGEKDWQPISIKDIKNRVFSTHRVLH